MGALSVPSRAGDGAQRRLTTLRALLCVAVAVSIVHYVDNYANYGDYPQPSSGPAPSRSTVGVSWFVFTAFAVAGYALYVRGRLEAAALCLALYSVSGLIGMAHYTVAGATGMPLWRQAHIVADILCGWAVLGFAAWTFRHRAAGRPAQRGAPG